MDVKKRMLTNQDSHYKTPKLETKAENESGHERRLDTSFSGGEVYQ